MTNFFKASNNYNCLMNDIQFWGVIFLLECEEIIQLTLCGEGELLGQLL